MPNYSYSHPETGQIKDVFQHMNDVHTYAENGVEWKRVWNTVEAAASTKLDPFSEQQFIDKLGSTKDNMGGAWDRSNEMSEKRAEQAGGVDPVKAKHYDEYAKLRRGKRNPREIREKLEKTTFYI